MAFHKPWTIEDEKLEISRHIEEVYLDYHGDEVNNFVHGLSSIRRIRVKKFDHRYSCRHDLEKVSMFAQNDDINYELPLDFDLILNYIITHVLETRPTNLVRYIASLLEVCMERRQFLELQANTNIAPSGGFNYFDKHKHKKSGILLADLIAINLFPKANKKKKPKNWMRRKVGSESKNEETEELTSLDTAIQHLRQIERYKELNRCQKYKFGKDSCHKFDNKQTNKKVKNKEYEVQKNNQGMKNSPVKLPTILDSKKSNAHKEFNKNIKSKEKNFVAKQHALNDNLKIENDKAKNNENVEKSTKHGKIIKKIDFTKAYCNKILKDHRKFWYEERMKRKQKEQESSKREIPENKKRKPKSWFTMEDSETSICLLIKEIEKEEKNKRQIQKKEMKKMNEKIEHEKKEKEKEIVEKNNEIHKIESKKVHKQVGKQEEDEKDIEDTKKESEINERENELQDKKSKIDKEKKNAKNLEEKKSERKLEKIESIEKGVSKNDEEIDEEDKENEEDDEKEEGEKEEEKEELPPFEIVNTGITFDVIDAEFFEDPVLLKQTEPLFNEDKSDKKIFLELKVVGDLPQ